MNEYQMKSFPNVNAEEAYNQYINYWRIQRSLPSDTLEATAERLRNQTEFQALLQYEKSVKVFFDQSNFRISFITNNIKDLLGYTREEMMRYNGLLLFSTLVFDHILFPIKLTKMGFRIRDKVPRTSLITNYRIVIFGIKLRKKDGTIRRFLFDCRAVEFDDEGIMQTILVTIEDVTHIIKSDLYWCRVTCGENEAYKFYQHSDKKMEVAQDIISEREKDVLRLIAKGLESKEIGSQLFISSGTVDNHRKNMIARTGVRDTTALLQLCISCGII